MIKAIKFLGEFIYEIATISSHPTGHPNFDNEASKRNWRESQKGGVKRAHPNCPNSRYAGDPPHWPGDKYGG